VTVRDSFIEHFGAKNASAIESAAIQHNHETHKNPGNDTFQWSICMVLSYQCVEQFAADHEIGISNEDFLQWVRDHADLDNYDGDVDALGLAVGCYDEFMPNRANRQMLDNKGEVYVDALSEVIDRFSNFLDETGVPKND
jgi:hypothetical protein